MILSHQKFDLGNKRLIEKVVIQAPFRLVNHFQDEACFIHFSEGDATINSARESVAVHPNDAVLLKCGTFFSDLLKYTSGDRFEILVFHLYPDILRRIYKTELPSIMEGPKNDRLADKIVSGEIINKFVDSLQFYFENPLLVNAELLTLKIRELILLLLQSQKAGSIADLFSDLFSSRNVRIKEIIDNHLFAPLSIKDLAELANLSVSTFNRSFQKLYNKTPAGYLKEKRLDRARQLLQVSSQTISEIALETCFSDEAHFSRSFKSLFHVTPSQYRQSTQSF
jgi:AraC family transcriptional regulator, exoenzyme S synthesis regulatory protein ExsA